jgi:ArsR family transcriptional regulator
MMQLTDRLSEAELLAALGNEHRLRIVELLRGRERCVCEITPQFDLDPSVVSRHLAVLERAGIVRSRRDGRWIHYQLADRRVLRLIETARQLSNAPGRAGSAQRPSGRGKAKCLTPC